MTEGKGSGLYSTFSMKKTNRMIRVPNNEGIKFVYLCSKNQSAQVHK